MDGGEELIAQLQASRHIEQIEEREQQIEAEQVCIFTIALLERVKKSITLKSLT